MNDLIYEYVPSENIIKINPNDFKMLLQIKKNLYEKLIKKVPNNVLQQRIDKANELLTKYFCSWDYTACEFKDVIKILSTLSIILNSENWKNRAEVKEMIEGEE